MRENGAGQTDGVRSAFTMLRAKIHSLWHSHSSPENPRVDLVRLLGQEGGMLAPM